MKLRRDSRLVRWAFYGDVVAGDDVPEHSSLCVVFWRSLLGIFFNPLAFVLRWRWARVAGLVLWGGYMAGSIVWFFVTRGWMALLYAVAFLAGVALVGGLMILGFMAFEKVEGHPRGYLAIEFLKAKKRRVCPLIEIEQ